MTVLPVTPVPYGVKAMRYLDQFVPEFPNVVNMWEIEYSENAAKSNINEYFTNVDAVQDATRCKAESRTFQD
jgi:hypothetical protein